MELSDHQHEEGSNSKSHMGITELGDAASDEHHLQGQYYWGMLSVEVVELIFARMPVKAVVCASCVCKQWHAIVQSRTFVTFILKYWSNKKGRTLI
ncbi:unnamed protein product [Sphagnum balticum]